MFIHVCVVRIDAWVQDVDEPYKLFEGAAAFEDADQLSPTDPITAQLPIPPPAPGALVFFALHDVPLAMGPTELTVGSHIFSAVELRAMGLGSRADRPFEHRMELRQGDIMVMDIRTLHHGTANNAKQPRTLLYVA
jgi:ectoine hydroxylase-related dioxygenase (phytanoyl-CoA dioxygenase family)